MHPSPLRKYSVLKFLKMRYQSAKSSKKHTNRVKDFKIQKIYYIVLYTKSIKRE